MASDKLISANALLEKIQYRIDTPGIIGATVRDMVATTRRIVEDAPAVGAVEVIRCKDCWKSDAGLCSYRFKNVPGKDFCGDGERRE